MAEKSPLQKLVAPSLPLKLDLEDSETGKKFTRAFRLSFNLNTLARIQEKTGLKVLGAGIWAEFSPQLLGAMLWAACIAHSPEYDTRDEDGNPTDEGLEVIQSYIDGRNVDMVSEKVWDAYLLSLSKEKADLLRKMRTGLSPSSEVPNEATPETGETTGSDSGPSQDTISDLATAKSAS